MLPTDATGIALRTPGREPVSYPELRHAVREIAGGLAALGVAPGDRVAILSATRPEWVLADFGALAAGAVVVPVYHTNSRQECAYVLEHSGSRVVFVEDAAQAAKIAPVRDLLPSLEHVIVLEGRPDGALTLAELRRLGAERSAPEDTARAPDDAATIVYTSGTTGPPKGCVLTHANLLAVADASIERLDLSDPPPVIFLYLPLAHVLARLTAFVALATGGTLVFWSGQRERLADELALAAPTHVPTVPRLLEKVRTRVLATKGPRGALLRHAVASGDHSARCAREGSHASRGRRVRHAIADRLVLAQVRKAFGPRRPVILTGAAPIGREVLEFFDACGITVLEGYGMTETAAASTLNTPLDHRLGSVGRPLPGAEVSIAADGEILLRGPHVFAGYHRDPEATDAVLEDGWLHSGDLGELDADGFLHVTGRKKDLIITSSGKNISPEAIESALRETRWISQAVVFGDRRPYLVALVTLDPDELSALAEEIGLKADPKLLARDARARALVWNEIEAVNQRFARIEQIKRFAILPRDFTQPDGELTPTLKIKRNVVYSRYARVFEQIYAKAGP
ncbi:MAG TPA: long-chain fatty acid--CoA ligase [Solirubrobacter sp.]